MPTRTDYERMLRAAGLRVTRPRVSVLSAVHEHPHADACAVIEVVRADLGETSHQAVYGVLHALTDARLVRCLQPGGSAARYEARVGDNHHHLVCRICGAIADVDCAAGEAPCLTPSDDAGFDIGEAEIVYWGRCPRCAQQAGTQTAGARRAGNRTAGTRTATTTAATTATTTAATGQQDE